MTTAVTSATTSPGTGQTPAQAPASSTDGASSGLSAAAINANFDMFLKMLTTQLRNQDPLNPIDSSDFAVQLATFSGVEQQAETNKLLKGLSASLGQTGLSQLAGWIGMEARVTAPTAFDGNPITLAPAPEAGADQVVLLVKNASGKTVVNKPIPLSSASYEWDGTDAAGTKVPTGNYTFALQNYQNGQLIGTDPVPSYARIVEAQSSAGGTVLVLDSGAQIDAGSISALRSAH